MSEVIKFLWNSPKECPKSVEEAGQEPPPWPGSDFVLLYPHPQRKPCWCFTKAAVRNSKNGNREEEGRAVVIPKK